MMALRAALTVLCACVLLRAGCGGAAAQPVVTPGGVTGGPVLLPGQPIKCMGKSAQCGISAQQCCPPFRCTGGTPASSVCV